MIHRKTLRKKQPNAAMTLKKAKEIFKSMSHLHAKRKFPEYKNAYKYLLTLAYQNEFYINSLQLNNRALAKGMQKEKENSGQQLRERLATESMYLTLAKENSILRQKLSELERKFLNIDEQITRSMIPNLVNLSNDITGLKFSCDNMKSFLRTNDNNDESILPKPCPKIQTAGTRCPLFAGTHVPSPLLEEAEDEVTQIATRKCKGGLRNILNLSNLRVTDRKTNRSLIFSSSNSESSFVEHNSNVEKNFESKMPKPEHTSTPRYSPKTPIMSPVCHTSPAVLLRRVLTPCNLLEQKDSSHSSASEISTEKSGDASNLNEENLNNVSNKKGRKRLTTSYFAETEENGCNLFTERKKSKRSHFFEKSNNENKQMTKNETRKSIRRMSIIQKKEETNDENADKPKSKRSSSRMSLSQKKEGENVDPNVPKNQPKNSLSNRRMSKNICDEPEPHMDHCTLLSDRKKYSRSQLSLGDENVTKTLTNKTEHNTVNLTIDSSVNEITDSSLNGSRRLRNCRKNVSYKEKPLNIKLRKN